MIKEIQKSLKNSKILVVDDTEFSRAIINEVLVSHGFKQIKMAVDGQEALDITHEWHPDIVLLDIMLPKVDGFEYCRKIRKVDEFKSMPILVQTALSDPEKRVEAFSCGATDLITKPIYPDELLTRVIIHVEKQALLNDLNLYKTRVAEELESAKKMQNLLMPSVEQKSEIKKDYNVEIGGYFQPSSEIGGDFWGSRAISESKFSIYSVDFSGHGITSALNTFRLHTIMEGSNSMGVENPDEYLKNINKKLFDLLRVDQFATMFYGVVDIEEGVIKYSTASSPSPIIIKSKSKNSTILSSSSLPLGVDRKAKFELKELKFDIGDVFVLYSDALTETPNLSGKFMSEEKIADSLNIASRKLNSAQEITDSLIDKFFEHIESKGNIRDDMTLSIFKRF